MTTSELQDSITEMNRKLRIMDATIKNLEALIDRKLRPVQEKLNEHEQALEIVADHIECSS